MSQFPTSFSELSIPNPRDDTGEFSITLHLETVTPILGGGTETRRVDEDEPIRGATIRGHLRAWWRATLPELPMNGEDVDAEKLYKMESQIWGGTDGEEKGVVRSAVRVQVGSVEKSKIRREEVGFRDDGFYALWTARSQSDGTPAAERWTPGLKFKLTVRGPKTDDVEAQVRDALRAWILFGGYGGRTRRGLGALRLIDVENEELSKWLPSEAKIEAVRILFDNLSLGRTASEPLTDMFRLKGAGLALGTASPKGEAAAWNALRWLSDFRQAQPPVGDLNKHDKQFARRRGEANRPSISNWPEPDKMRHIEGKTRDHKPYHNPDPAWPRAGFGLPIQTQWQKKGRNGGRYDEPRNFQLQWRRADERDPHDRLASPLIVGPLQILNGKFAPFALWLHRGYPKGGEVVPCHGKRPIRGKTAAPFDKLLGAKDTAQFEPLEAARKEPAGFRLRKAFFTWLRKHNHNLKVED